MGYYLGLLAAITPKRSCIKELCHNKTHLGSIAHQETFIFEDTLQSYILHIDNDNMY